MAIKAVHRRRRSIVDAIVGDRGLRVEFAGTYRPTPPPKIDLAQSA